MPAFQHHTVIDLRLSMLYVQSLSFQSKNIWYNLTMDRVLEIRAVIEILTLLLDT